MTGPTHEADGSEFLFESGATLNHPHFTKTLDDAIEAIETSDGGGTVQIVGCTGVGKTHLRRDLESHFLELDRDRMNSDTSYMPVASFPVKVLSKTGFSWAAFTEDFLKALRHPNPLFSNLKDGREKMISAAQARRPRTVIIDEAHHILNGCRDDKAVHTQSEVLKSICEDTGLKLTLIGTYDLIPLLRTNGQAARRNHPVHFNRYHNCPAERDHFRNILAAIDKECTGSLAFSLVDNADLIYVSCIGLVGILRNWLVRAKANSMNAGEPKITMNAMLAKRLTESDLIPILKESQAGEKLLQETAVHISILQELLRDEWHIRKVVRPDPDRKRRPRSKRFGRRNPVREPVGTEVGSDDS